MFSGYLLFLKFFKSQWLACLGFLILVFHPRLYAHSFFNTKDMPFLAMFLVSLALSERVFSTKKTTWFVLLGIACGYTTSIRIMGIMLVVFLCGFFLLDIIRAYSTNRKMTSEAKNLLLFLLFFSATVILAWPTLWSNPVGHFLEAFGSMSVFRWEGEVLLHGTSFTQDQIPWYYIPRWFFVTTPVLWVVLG